MLLINIRQTDVFLYKLLRSRKKKSTIYFLVTLTLIARIRVKSVLKHYLCTKQATGSVPNTGKVYSGVSIGGRKLLKTESP